MVSYFFLLIVSKDDVDMDWFSRRQFKVTKSDAMQDHIHLLT
jgi:hypothetical protein